ncbi:MAG: hypothetical protein Q9201_000960 [Fulgogasparrea decipioides]
MQIQYLFQLLLVGSLTYDAGVVGRAIIPHGIAVRDDTVYRPVEKALAHRAVVEPVGAPKAPAPKPGEGAPKAPGESSGEPSDPSSPDPESVPGNPDSQSGDPGGESDNSAIPGQPKEDTQPKDEPQPAPKDPNSDPNKKPNCKRDLTGRAMECSDDESETESDQEMVDYYDQAEEGMAIGRDDDVEMASDDSSENTGLDEKGWPLSDDDAPTDYTTDLMKPYDENAYRDDGVTAQRYLTRQIPQNPPSWRPYTEKYTPTETKNANPVGELKTVAENNMRDIFDRLGIKYDQTAQDWNKVSMKSEKQNKEGPKQGVVNRAWFSKSQKTITIDEARKMYDGNDKADRIPVSELNKQEYERQAGDANFRWIVQPRINGKGSKKAIKELFNKHGWSPDEWRTFDFSKLDRNSNIDRSSDETVISGIDNVKTFERMAGGYGKQIKTIYIRGKGTHEPEPVIAIEFAA